MKWVCCYYDDCDNADSIICNNCVRNLINNKIKDHFHQKALYVPTCPQGWEDCVYDPAYIKYFHPEWYKTLYGDMTPEEAAMKHCNPNEENCYDDEDK